VAALELLGDREVTPALIATLADPDEAVRVTAVRALGSLGDKRAVQPLVRALQDGSSEVRFTASAALEELGALARLRDPAATEALIAALNGPRHIRVAAGSALMYSGNARAVEPLLEALLDEVATQPPQAHWGDTFAVSLGHLGPVAVPALVGLLQRKERELRRLGVVGLVYVQDERALAALRAVLQDPDPMVRLSVLSHPALRSERRAALRDPNSLVRQQAQATLEYFGEDVSPPTSEGQ
jgi:HEAT repeat protein